MKIAGDYCAAWVHGRSQGLRTRRCRNLPKPGDTFLLASDGFWEWINECEMEQDLAAAARPKDWLERMETRIQERVSGDHDNYSAIAVACEQKNTESTPKEIV